MMEVIKNGKEVGWYGEFICRTVFGKGCGARLKVGQKDLYRVDFLVKKATFCCQLCATEVDIEYHHRGVELLGKRPSENQKKAIIRRSLGYKE